MTNVSLLASLPSFPSAGENASFVIVGFLFVLLTLALLSLATLLIGQVFKRLEALEAREKASPPPAPPAPAATSEDTEKLGDHLLPIISAAAHLALQGRPHRIVGIKPSSHGWAQEGRRQIFSSHQVR